MSLRRGIWAVVALALLPAVLVAVSLGTLPTGPAAWLDLAGRVCGAAGLACLLLAGAISVRVPGFDRAFGGLTRLWKLHHREAAEELLADYLVGRLETPAP